MRLRQAISLFILLCLLVFCLFDVFSVFNMFLFFAIVLYFVELWKIIRPVANQSEAQLQAKFRVLTEIPLIKPHYQSLFNAQVIKEITKTKLMPPSQYIVDFSCKYTRSSPVFKDYQFSYSFISSNLKWRSFNVRDIWLLLFDVVRSVALLRRLHLFQCLPLMLYKVLGNIHWKKIESA